MSEDNIGDIVFPISPGEHGCTGCERWEALICLVSTERCQILASGLFFPTYRDALWAAESAANQFFHPAACQAKAGARSC